MPHIQPHSLPPQALLAKYDNTGAYTDCFVTEIARTVSHAEFVEAFYTGRLFKVEQFLLRVFISKPSTDLQARQLAAGELNAFAAWRVEARAVDQVLLCAIDGRTRSWLMVSAADVPGRTQLYFGSAVLPNGVPSRAPGSAPDADANAKAKAKPDLGPVFRALLGFHIWYARALLGAAAARLMRAGA